MIGNVFAEDQVDEVGEIDNQDLSFNVGSDFTTAYFFRGIMQENQGFIAQPWIGASLKLSDKNTVSVLFWNSIHDNDTGATGGDVEAWYEADISITLTHALTDKLSVNTGYRHLMSPNSAFNRVNEVFVGASFTDSLLGENRAHGGLNPFVDVVFEVDGTSDGDGDEGIYSEIGIRPRFDLVDNDAVDLDVTIPVKVGLGVQDYYGDSGFDFGYFSVGAVFGTPMKFFNLPNVTLTAGVEVLVLGDDAKAFNGGDDTEVIGTVGFSTSF